MRWKRPTHGDIKIKKKFALLPITVVAGYETRWLEWVNIKYEYCEDCWCFCGWMPMEFIDDEEVA